MKNTNSVNYISHHKNVSNQFFENKSSRPIYISLYNALFFIWNSSGFQKELSINRENLMYMAKIGSRSTYVKALRWLDENDFLQYSPSKDYLIGSKIIMINKSRIKSGASSSYKNEPSFGATTSIDEGPYIKVNKPINNNKLNKQMIKNFSELNKDELHPLFEELNSLDSLDGFFEYFDDNNWLGFRGRELTTKEAVELWVTDKKKFMIISQKRNYEGEL